MISITPENYQMYKEVFEILFSALFGRLFTEGVHPVKILESWEKTDEAKARAGLKLGLQDCLAHIKVLPQNNLLYQEINQQLASRALPSLRYFIKITDDIVAHIIKRGVIENEDEYFLLKEHLESNSRDSSSDTKIQSMIDMFETN